MPGIFVTATGTEIGKTYVTAGLIRAARRAGHAVDALKPVLTGYDGIEAAQSDAGVLLAALGIAPTPAAIASISPWRYAAPLAPSMAAAAEGERLDVVQVLETCRTAARGEPIVFIEGIGGVMVPLDDRHTVLDLIAGLPCPSVLVAGSALGALSHTLTAVEALNSREKSPALLIVNESAGSGVSLNATCATLASFCAMPVDVVPRDAGDDVFDRLLARVLRRI